MDISGNLYTVYQVGRKECQQNIPWFDNNFWDNVTNPNDHHLHDYNNTQMLKPILVAPITQELETNISKPFIRPNVSNDITRKYFREWNNYAKRSKESREDLHKQMQQKEKLSNFLDSLKEHKQKLKDADNVVRVKAKAQNTSCYEYRFEAQKNIIELQKLKLVKQEKIIEQLKLDKLNEELNQSIQETEKDIEEAFLKCSTRLKSTAKPILQSISQQSILSLYPTSKKAPKIVQEMESRAFEREERRKNILERKRILEQKRKEHLQMEIERKKVQDEEIRKESLKAIKERRKKELEHQQMLKMIKQNFLEKCTKAESFYKKKLKRLVFKALSRLITIKQNNINRSKHFYKLYLKRIVFSNWMKLISQIYDKKYSLAGTLYNFKLLRKMFVLWLSMYTMSCQNFQVAEDLYEMRLQSKSFIYWHRYTCTQYVLCCKNLKISQKHYNSRILLHYFYQWRSLPAVLRIEKAKEEKKQRWREKVWEILPDYNPVVED